MRTGLLLLLVAGCSANRVVGVRYTGSLDRPSMSAGAEWDYGQGKAVAGIEEGQYRFESMSSPAGGDVMVSGMARCLTLRSGVALTKGNGGLSLTAGLSAYSVDCDALSSEDSARLSSLGATMASRSDADGPGVTMRIEAYYNPIPSYRLAVFAEVGRCLASSEYRYLYDDPADPFDIPSWRTEETWLDIERATAGIAVSAVF